ncbi:MAG: glycosyltransferase family 4 protein [Deltaproteobacteria bacterium]|nr:glycosyltransferase family 4 protein [Deltaproteobacteria bacterium]MBW2344500.1 glycosyltransferase family 4 protein [Deltaproteobacteria bacterium]
MFVKDFAHELAKKTELVVLTQHTGRGPEILHESNFQVIRFQWSGRDKALSTLRFPGDFILMSSVIIRGLFASLRIATRHKVHHTLALWTIPSGLWALLLKWIYSIPYTVWCLGADIWDYKRNPITKWLLRLILRQAQSIYADGHKLKQEVRSLCGKKCYYLASSRRLPSHVSVKADIRHGKKNYLFIGRYHPNKGPDILLKAIARLNPLIREKVHFHFFGGGTLRPVLQEFILSQYLSDVVTLHGYIDEELATAYLKACDAVIIPSRKDTISLVISDALQTGTPIIATDTGDMGYFLKRYKAGTVVPSNCPEKLAEAIASNVLKKKKIPTGQSNLLDLLDISKSAERFFSDQL